MRVLFTPQHFKIIVKFVIKSFFSILILVLEKRWFRLFFCKNHFKIIYVEQKLKVYRAISRFVLGFFAAMANVFLILTKTSNLIEIFLEG